MFHVISVEIESEVAERLLIDIKVNQVQRHDDDYAVLVEAIEKALANDDA